MLLAHLWRQSVPLLESCDSVRGRCSTNMSPLRGLGALAQKRDDWLLNES